MAEREVGRGRKGRAGNPRGTSYEAAGGAGPDHSFTLQAIMEVQKSVGSLEMEVRKGVGSLENAIKALSERVDRQQRTINWMARVLWMAAGAALVLGPLVTWVVTNRFDEILNALAKSAG